MTSRHANATSSRSSLKPLALRIATVSLAALTLTACKHNEGGEHVLGWSLIDPAERHPIMVTQAPTTLDVEVLRGRHVLMPYQRAAVMDFAKRFRREGTQGKLVIAAPAGAPNEVAAVQAISAIRHIVRMEGIAAHHLSIEAYSDEANPNPPIKLSFVKHVAEGPDCGRWHSNVAEDYRNLPYPNLGCATQKNLAAMVANPQDLVNPRTETTPRLGERRDVVWGKWIRGEATGAQKSDEEKAKVKE